MTEEERKVLLHFKKILKTKTAGELFETLHRLAKRIKTESQKESNPKEKFKSEFTDPCE